MKTEIKKITDVEFELEINAEAGDLADKLNEAIRSQRAQTNMKGFRPGKVPTSLVRKMYGKGLAYGVAEEMVQSTFRSRILSEKQFDVLGQPTITELKYEFEGDLKAIVRFGVRPTIDLKNLAKVKISRLAHTVSDEDVQKEIDALLSQHAEFTPDDGPAKKDSHVIVDMQRMDKRGKEPDGDIQKDVPFLLSDESLMPELKKVLTGMKVGKSKKVKFKVPDSKEKRRYEVTLKEVKIRTLPDLDGEMVKTISNDEAEDAATLRSQIKDQLIDGWEKRSIDLFQSDAIKKMIDLHPFDVPSSVVDMYLEAYLKDIKSRNEDKELPAEFNMDEFREEQKEQAENQARWMFLRDAIIADQDLGVTDKERDAHFEKTAARMGFGADMMKSYYQSMPELMDQLDQAILSDSVFAYLGDSMKVTEKDEAAYTKEMKKG